MNPLHSPASLDKFLLVTRVKCATQVFIATTTFRYPVQKVLFVNPDPTNRLNVQKGTFALENLGDLSIAHEAAFVKMVSENLVNLVFTTF